MGQRDWRIVCEKGEKEVNKNAGKPRTRAVYCTIGEEGEMEA